MALEFAIEMAGRRREAREVRLHSLDFEQIGLLLPRTDPSSPTRPTRGATTSAACSGRWSGPGWSCAGWTWPSAGTSRRARVSRSSAALEVATAEVARALLGFDIQGPPLARLCQQAENDFVGMKCGIMDQFISLMGRADHALFLDCRSLEHRLVPLDLGEHVIAIIHSGVKHELVGSEYNTRRDECGAGLAVIRKRFPAVAALRDATLEQLAAAEPDLTPVLRRRCRHVITECARVLESTAALRRGDLARFGQLMNESHDSLRDDYEVSCPEIDLLVSLARRVRGLEGARITGGGFGGCTVNLLPGASVQSLKGEVLGPYEQQVGIKPELFITRAADGAAVV